MDTITELELQSIPRQDSGNTGVSSAEGNRQLPNYRNSLTYAETLMPSRPESFSLRRRDPEASNTTMPADAEELRSLSRLPPDKHAETLKKRCFEDQGLGWGSCKL